MVDCSACQYGGNGERNCAEGFNITKPGVNGCNEGKPIEVRDDSV
ncbi:MAG: hypothetical protein ACM3TR_09695 [Caulobacteraceae bacterium]